MTLHHVQTFSREEADAFVHGRHPASLPLTRQFQGRLAWIGCVWTLVDRSPARHARGPLLELAFHDVNREDKPGSALPYQMTPQLALQASVFVERFHHHAQPWALLIHCQMGVHRSGALAQWAQERYRILPSCCFAFVNARIQPNPFVLRLLRETPHLCESRP